MKKQCPGNDKVNECRHSKCFINDECQKDKLPVARRLKATSESTQTATMHIASDADVARKFSESRCSMKEVETEIKTTWQKVVLFVTGFLILQFFIVLVTYQIAFQNGREFNFIVDKLLPFCSGNGTFDYDDKTYSVTCKQIPARKKK